MYFDCINESREFTNNLRLLYVDQTIEPEVGDDPVYIEVEVITNNGIG